MEWVAGSHVAQWVGCQAHALEVVGLIPGQFRLWFFSF